MTKILLDIEDNVWMAFKKSVPRDVKFPDAVCLLIIHYIDMRESGKTLMKVLMEKYGIEGTVKVFGTPAEETLVGKIIMARMIEPARMLNPGPPR